MAKSRRQPPKPPLAARETMTDVFQIRLSAAEKQAFSTAAALDGKKIAEWMRDRLRRLAREELQAHGQDVPFLPVQQKGNE